MDPKKKDAKQTMSYGQNVDDLYDRDLYDDDFSYEDWDDVIPDEVPRRDGPGGESGC